jgi:putative membrane protein
MVRVREMSKTANTVSSLWNSMQRLKTKHLKLFVLYLLLIAGGLWHLLGVLERTMTAGAPLAMAALAVWLAWEYFRMQRKPEEQKTAKSVVLAIWMLIVFAGSVFVEYLGVQTGIVFGTYSYGTTLKPTVGSVPLVIGFAWLSMLLSSMAVMERLLGRFGTVPLVLKALTVSLLMVIFDYIMEPAAVELGYWSWEGGIIPVQNYLAWFIISFVFVILAYGLNLFKKGVPVISRHAYYAQLMYFVLVNMKS